MFLDFNNLKNHNAISAIYGIFFRGCTLPEKDVPFSYVGRTFFCGLKKGISGLRTAGLAILFWTVFLAAPATEILAEPLSLEQLSAKIQQSYDKTKDLKARFIQEITIQSMKKTDREEGTVWIKNPKMMFWDYAKPKEKKLVINARTAWLYVADDRIVYVQKADDIYQSRTAVKFLSGIGKLSDDFHLRFEKENPQDEEGNYLLDLTAKEKGNGIDRLRLTVDGKSFQILECRFSDEYGNTTRLRFSDIQINTGVSDQFFTFKPPAGVEVVRMSQ